MRAAFAASIFVILCLVLVFIGLLSPSEMSFEGDYKRALAGTTWSALPVFLSIPAATIGGQLISPKKFRLNFLSIVIAAPICLAALLGAFVAGQRTSVGVIVISLAIAVALYLSMFDWRRVIVLGLVLIVGVYFYNRYAGEFRVAETTLVQRTMRSESASITGDLDERVVQYTTFLGELVLRPSLKPPGFNWFVQKVGYIPHLLVAEAYCYGGLFFMGVVLWLFIIAWWRTVRGWLQSRRQAGESLRLCCLSVLVALTLTMCFHPGMHVRCVFLLLGMCVGTPYYGAYRTARIGS
jgi:hypothetical protein